MKQNEAVALIGAAIPKKMVNNVWADLGCGSGTFTKALSVLLGDGNRIFAVDNVNQQIESSDGRSAQIEFIKIDFVNDVFPFSLLDGILMANALHYVKDKAAFISKIKKHLKPKGQLVVIEYETEKANPWVPYPISFDNLRNMLLASGFKQVEKIGERESIYRSGGMYACNSVNVSSDS
jgi:ubiquinone/menaquinone biosynthesis C-methylase UbiE